MRWTVRRQGSLTCQPVIISRACRKPTATMVTVSERRQGSAGSPRQATASCPRACGQDLRVCWRPAPWSRSDTAGACSTRLCFCWPELDVKPLPPCLPTARPVRPDAADRDAECPGPHWRVSQRGRPAPDHSCRRTTARPSRGRARRRGLDGGLRARHRARAAQHRDGHLLLKEPVVPPSLLDAASTPPPARRRSPVPAGSPCL